MNSPPTAKSHLLLGARDTIPMIVGAIPFGIIFGALGVVSGLSPLATMGMSLFVFAGSAQFVAVGLVAQGAGIAIIVLTTFVVNLRHALYSASLAPHLHYLSQRWLLPLGFWLTDETYAVVINRYRSHADDPHKHWYYLGSALAMYGNWQICTAVGIVAGQNLQGMAEWGLEFAMVVTFIGIVVPMLVNRPMLLCALASGVVALWLRDLPHQLGLIVGSVAGLMVGLLFSAKRREPNVEEGA
ncbi:MAG: AzlC family ABC transporter permease [Gammaproteobacteria bacterium]